MDYEENDLANEVQELVNEDYMSDEKLRSVTAAELVDAIDFIDNTVSPVRANATKYYRGEPFGDEEEGRSQVVSMDVRDAVQAVLPSLMRIFTSSERAVEFTPVGPEDVEMADQATDYVNHVFLKENNGFTILHAAFKDALIRKAGIIKFFWDDSASVETYELTGLTDEALAALTADPDVSIDVMSSIEQPLPPELQGLPITAPMIHDVRISRRMSGGRIRVEAVPPEEFLIDRRAKSLADAEFCAHRRLVTVSDLVAMGYDEDMVEKLAANEDAMDMNVERFARKPSGVKVASRTDEAMRKVMYYETYIRVDRDGDGYAELRKVCLAGSGHVLLADEPCDAVPFASMTPDPEPHEFFGTSVADVVMDIQRIKSVVMRNVLDSLAMSIHPRVVITEGQVNVADILNTEVGAVIRARSAGQVQPMSMPFVGQQAFPVLGYLDDAKQSRTGISKASSGLDANALQSSTASAVAATVSAAQQHIEMIARVFAETGIKDLFRGILRLMVKHQDQARVVRLRNKFVAVDPSVWNAEMDVTVNVALGRGSDTERMVMLSQILDKQKEVITTMGPQNPLTTIGHIYNTLSEMTSLAGFKDASRFWTNPADYTPPPPQPPKPDVNEQLIQVQIQQIQADMQMKMADLKFKYDQLKLQDDLKRDEMEAELHIEAARLKATNNGKLDVEEVKRKANIDRETLKAQADIIKKGVFDDGN